MKKKWLLASAFASAALYLAAFPTFAQTDSPAPPPQTQLTVYNGDFAVARTGIALHLHTGINNVQTTDVTSQLEPDSVVLRDPQGRHAFRILEQNYDAAVVDQAWLLEKFEGKTLQFLRRQAHTEVTASGQIVAVPEEIVTAKLVRAGQNPLVEVDGRLQFFLPGTPLFPASTDGLLLKPTLRWKIESADAAQINAELDYVTHGLSWQATYNVVVPEETAVGSAEKADMAGWVTMANNSGTDFADAGLQLMAGDVAKLPINGRRASGGGMQFDSIAQMAPTVVEKSFDDFHLYTLPHAVSLRHGETKQVQFLDASAVTVTRRYEYHSSSAVPIFSPGFHNVARIVGGEPSKRVEIEQEIGNSKTNHLGLPLPGGRVRVYRREATGQVQFVGESTVGHTPEDQTMRITSGYAFDLTAEHTQTDFHVDQNNHIMDETFSVKLSNAKPVPVTIHVIENLNRAENWQITEHSTDFVKNDAHTLDFATSVPAKGSSSFTYTVHYTW